MKTQCSSPGYENAFGALRQFVRRASVTWSAANFAAPKWRPEHPHLIEPGTQQAAMHLQRLRDSVQRHGNEIQAGAARACSRLQNFHLSDGQWESLMVPDQHGFLFPQHAGRTSGCVLSQPRGSDRVAACRSIPGKISRTLIPLLAEMEPDVEALLVNRVGHARGFAAPEYYVLPIDECYKLVGLIRANWRGLSGGTEVWQRDCASSSMD